MLISKAGRRTNMRGNSETGHCINTSANFERLFLKADHPERPIMTLGWSLEHPPGNLRNHVFLLDVMVSQPIRVASQ